MAFVLQYRCRIESTAERVYQTITDLSAFKLFGEVADGKRFATWLGAGSFGFESVCGK